MLFIQNNQCANVSYFEVTGPELPQLSTHFFSSLFFLRILSTEEKNAQHAADCNSEGTELIAVGQNITRLFTSRFSSVKWENNSTAQDLKTTGGFKEGFLAEFSE